MSNEVYSSWDSGYKRKNKPISTAIHHSVNARKIFLLTTIAHPHDSTSLLPSQEESGRDRPHKRRNKNSRNTYPTKPPVSIDTPVSIAVAPRVSCPLLKRQKLKRKTRKDRRPDNSMTDGFFDSGLGFEERSGR
jgi:hypothetical protein